MSEPQCIQVLVMRTPSSSRFEHQIAELTCV